MTRFRGCIDLHSGAVKQIVGGTLSDSSPSTLQTNHISFHSPSHFAHLYRDHNVTGTHVIKLGPNCDAAAEEALAGWPRQLQIGGGISGDNAAAWIEKGAEKVIVTSWLFPDAVFSLERLKELVGKVGKEKLVVDLSCRKRNGGWWVAMDRWQTVTGTEVNKETLDLLMDYCSEFLVHAADVEGLCCGIDEDLVKALGEWATIPITYAGGAKSIDDLVRVQDLSGGKVDLTYGSALDIFGGDKVKFEDCVNWNEGKL